ncbi:MAG: hypothetical protein OXB92_03030 [Acidimicrobiaceae bacterium]|nr:hypothetical protein [Acidimicrobiia bacterium]MCY4492817.1 hypothetical protein [Acidimicrobiaceae bacterium]
MFVFFVAAAVLGVLLIFDSPAVDYRYVAAGAVLPLAEAVTGRPLILHTLAGSVLLLGLVMLSTVGSRLLRRRLLGVPIATFVFLVVSGAWTRTDLFWWPVAGFDGIAAAPLPEFDRPLAVLVLFEMLGICAVGWLIHRFELTRPENRRMLFRSGRLPREHTGARRG